MTNRPNDPRLLDAMEGWQEHNWRVLGHHFDEHGWLWLVVAHGDDCCVVRHDPRDGTNSSEDILHLDSHYCPSRELLDLADATGDPEKVGERAREWRDASRALIARNTR